jgi:hypothetical protein
VLDFVGFLKSDKMKRYWKVRVSNLKESLIYLGVVQSYIKILLNNELIQQYKYIYIIFDEDTIFDKTCRGWGWNNIDTIYSNSSYYSYLIKNNFEYCGEVNLRKLKLEKLNGKVLED